MPKPSKIAGSTAPSTGRTGARGAQHRARYALLLILVLAAFLRLWQFTSYPPPLHFDEAMNGNDALENIETGHLDVFYPQNGGREGLLIGIQTPMIWMFGNEAWVLRLPSAVFGILTVWGIYCLAAELFSAEVGLLAAFFLATSLWHLIFSRIGLRAIASPLFLAWGLFLLLDGLRRAGRDRPYLARIAIAGVVYGLGFYTYIAYRATPPLVLVVLVWFGIRARREQWADRLLKAAGLFVATAVLTVLPLLWYFVRHPETLLHRSLEISIWNSPQPLLELLRNAWKIVGMIFWAGDPDWLHNVASRPEVFLPVALLFLLGVALGLREIAARRDCFGYVIAISWLLLAGVPAVLSIENMPHSLRALLMAPAIMMLSAAGAWWLWSIFRAHLPVIGQRAAVIALLAILIAEPFYEYFYVWGPNPRVAEAFNSAGREIADRINALPRGTPKNVMVVTVGTTGGMPAPAQTVMFLTRSYTQRQQEESGIHYYVRQPGDPDGVDFCRKKGLELRGDAFCLIVNRASLPGR